jgi:hypothetical protein
MPVDPKSIGQDAQHKDACDAYDAANGTYQETPPEDIPEDSKFATGNMPMQQQQSPFKLGPMGSSDE